jgi:hypothetical protein
MEGGDRRGGSSPGKNGQRSLISNRFSLVQIFPLLISEPKISE